MKGFNGDIEAQTVENESFRKVLYTGKHSQLVLMCLKPGEAIGTETHHDTDQFFRCEQGQGMCMIDNVEYEIKDGSAVVVPAGARHNIINTSDTEALKLYTIYAPPHHKDGTEHVTKEAAEASDETFDGVTTE